MVLYTFHFPVNEFLHHKLGVQSVSPLCNHKSCIQNGTEESLIHYLLECPQYEVPRLSMIESIKETYRKYNLMENNHKIEFNTNKADPLYLKQFIFPSKRMNFNLRMKILKTIIKYVIATKRLMNMYTFST